jgi:phage terminase small subunit
MEVSGVGKSVNALLKELHEKKRWLDMMISGLEAAVESPEHRLIELAKETFEERQEASPRVDLERDGKAALATLARTVGSTPQARRRRSRPANQAVST